MVPTTHPPVDPLQKQASRPGTQASQLLNLINENPLLPKAHIPVPKQHLPLFVLRITSLGILLKLRLVNRILVKVIPFIPSLGNYLDLRPSRQLTHVLSAPLAAPHPNAIFDGPQASANPPLLPEIYSMAQAHARFVPIPPRAQQPPAALVSSPYEFPLPIQT